LKQGAYKAPYFKALAFAPPGGAGFYRAPFLGGVILFPQESTPIYKAPFVAPFLGPLSHGLYRGYLCTAYSIGIALFSFGKNAPLQGIGKVFIPPKIEALVGPCVGHIGGLSIRKYKP